MKNQINYEKLAIRLNARIQHGLPDECWPWTGALNSRGYGVIHLPRTEGNQLKLVHRMVIEVRDGPLLSAAEILHRCDNPVCCNPAHLQIGSHSDNMTDMAEKGRSCIGQRNAFAKLTDKAVLEIRTDLRSSAILAPIYGVAPQTIRKAKSGATWRHL
jgi:hypothetical protein